MEYKNAKSMDFSLDIILCFLLLQLNAWHLCYFAVEASMNRQKNFLFFKLSLFRKLEF